MTDDVCEKCGRVDDCPDSCYDIPGCDCGGGDGCRCFWPKCEVCGTPAGSTSIEIPGDRRWLCLVHSAAFHDNDPETMAIVGPLIERARAARNTLDRTTGE